MAALERPGVHRDIAFIVKLNSEPGRRMRWTFTTDAGLTESGVTSAGMEAAFKAGADAAEAAIDVAVGGKAKPRTDRKKKAANDATWTDYGAAIDVLRAAVEVWADDPSDENLTVMEDARAAADAQAKIFFRSIERK